LADHLLQYRGQLWQLKARHGTVVVLPERFISELCYLPEEFVSLEAKNTDVRKIGLPWDCRAELTHISDSLHNTRA
jgi:hypothetical protein